MSTITERVAAGGAFLDEHDPEWWRADVERAIDLEKLALSDVDHCILGQRCPVEAVKFSTRTRYSAYGRMLTGIETHSDLDDWAQEHAFNGQLGSEGEYVELTAEWKRVITERRAS